MTQHPGLTVRQAFGEETVTGAAKRLGVSRVALQRLVTGEADLSPAMALKVEAVYGLSADELVAQQAQYDLAQVRAK